MMGFVFILSGLPEKKKRSIGDDSVMTVICDTEIDVKKDFNYECKKIIDHSVFSMMSSPLKCLINFLTHSCLQVL